MATTRNPAVRQTWTAIRAMHRPDRRARHRSTRSSCSASVRWRSPPRPTARSCGRQRRGGRLGAHRPVVHRRRRQRRCPNGSSRGRPRPATATTAPRPRGSNYGPENEDLITAIGDRQAVIEELDGVAVGDIPADAVTASGSGPRPAHQPRLRPAAGAAHRRGPRARRGGGAAARRGAHSGTRSRLPRRADRQRAPAQHRARAARWIGQAMQQTESHG